MNRRTIIAWVVVAVVWSGVLLTGLLGNLESERRELWFILSGFPPALLIIPLVLIRKERGKTAKALPLLLASVSIISYGETVYILSLIMFHLGMEYTKCLSIPIIRLMPLALVTIVSTWASLITYAFKKTLTVLVWASTSLILFTILAYRFIWYFL